MTIGPEMPKPEQDFTFETWGVDVDSIPQVAALSHNFEQAVLEEEDSSVPSRDRLDSVVAGLARIAAQYDVITEAHDAPDVPMIELLRAKAQTITGILQWLDPDHGLGADPGPTPPNDLPDDPKGDFGA